jgi:hypothetical protein
MFLSRDNSNFKRRRTLPLTGPRVDIVLGRWSAELIRLCKASVEPDILETNNVDHCVVKSDPSSKTLWEVRNFHMRAASETFISQLTL